MGDKKTKLFIFEDYETISDRIIYLGDGCSLVLNVKIGMKDQNNRKISFLSEYQYPTNKYINKNKIISVKRSFFPFLNIEYKDLDSKFGKGQLNISGGDILWLRDKLNSFSSAIKKSFNSSKGNKIVFGDKASLSTIYLANGSLSFSPTTNANENNDNEFMIKMVINESHEVLMNIRKFYDFVYEIDSINLYQAASIMISGYMPITVGGNINNYNRESNNRFTEDDYYENSKPNNNGQRKGFFD